MRINATPDIVGNHDAVEELREGLANAVTVAVAGSGIVQLPPSHERDRGLEQDAVAQVAADAAPRVAAFLERAIAQRLARIRLYGGHAPPGIARTASLTDRQRRAG